MPDDPLAPQNPPPNDAPLFTPLGTPPPAGATSTGLAPNVAAGIAVLFTFVSGIVFLVIEKRSQYVRFWAMQATIYGLIWLAVRIVLEILGHLVSSFDTLIFLAHVWDLFLIAYVIGLVIMLYFAFTGKEWEFPGLGKIAREQLVKFPPEP